MLHEPGDLNMNELLKKYAKLAVRTGVNVQKGQSVLINVKAEHYEFARMLTEEAYEAGAKEVFVEFNDDVIGKYHFEYRDLETITHIPQWQKDKYKDYISKDFCRLSVYAPSPGLLKDISDEKLSASAKANGEAMKEYRQYSMSNQGQWSLISLPTPQWAKVVFPELDEKEGQEKLLDAILYSTRINKEDDPVDAWNKHNEKLHHQNKVLNEYNFKSIKFKNSLGTDLEVGLVKDHIWAGGMETSAKGHTFNPNMPTEESFTMPDNQNVNGVVYSTKPLNYNGKLIDEFWLKFENGKVIDFDAKKEKETLKSLLETDEGSSRIGELALISYDSPISNLNILFYNTLFDENASCHMALGEAYPMNLKGGLDMSREELKAHNANQSLLHEDFMFGSSDLHAVGVTYDGQEIDIIVDGNIII